jgi:hypothetical protein
MSDEFKYLLLEEFFPEEGGHLRGVYEWVPDPEKRECTYGKGSWVRRAHYTNYDNELVSHWCPTNPEASHAFVKYLTEEEYKKEYFVLAI